MTVGIVKASIATVRSAFKHRCCSFCPSVAKMRTQKRDFLKKLSNLELWSLSTTYRKSYNGLFKELIIGPLKFKMAEIRPLANRYIVIISTKDHPISIKFGTQQQVWNSVTVTRPNVIFKNLRCQTRTATI